MQNSIQINQATYQIDRIYLGSQTPAELIQGRLFGNTNQFKLTQTPKIQYNTDSGSVPLKEVT